MQAIALERYGGPEELHPVELPAPKLPPDALLIRTRAAGVNPVDAKIRAGALAERFPSFFPLVPGWDLAGTVERAGPAVHGFAPGDEVIGTAARTSSRRGPTQTWWRCAPRRPRTSRAR